LHNDSPDQLVTLSVIIPCFNEEKTLNECVRQLLLIEDEYLSLEIIIIDDGSTDTSKRIAEDLCASNTQIRLMSHPVNMGKGAALRTGFEAANGDYVAVQDADLEYDPNDLKRLLQPLRSGKADVVFGSRFLSSGAHRVLYFWHAVGNSFLTLISNMLTDLNLSDMETCYKVFRIDIIKNIRIEENRFGVEPELVAKIAQQRVRVYEMGISYYARTYEEGKKIGVKDGFRALYAIIKYNAHKAPVGVQFLLYVFIGAIAAAVNLLVFVSLFESGMNIKVATPVAFAIAAAANYLLCILLLFKHKVKWSAAGEVAVYVLLVCGVGLIDTLITVGLAGTLQVEPIGAKLFATAIGLLINFTGRKYFVFPEQPSGPWNPQIDRPGADK
jgi:glycosyltransferase involved in cell wall biosynthesis